MELQLRLRTLIKELNVSQIKAAGIISEQAQVPCSPRTVRAWLTPPEKSSARPCPEWAVEALQNANQGSVAEPA